MRNADVVEAMGLVLLVVALGCMVYALWSVGGPPAWFGAGGLLMVFAVVLIGAANRGDA